MAMSFIWDYSNVCGNSRWRGLTWAMIPLHTSGLAACTYHLFYNAPDLNALVALQAGLTFLGNCALWLATYRIYQSSTEPPASLTPSSPASPKPSFPPIPFYLTNLLAVSAASAATIKWGSLLTDFPFQPSYALASTFLLIPTLFNAAHWFTQSNPKS